jgi:hypothetical protein
MKQTLLVLLLLSASVCFGQETKEQIGLMNIIDARKQFKAGCDSLTEHNKEGNVCVQRILTRTEKMSPETPSMNSYYILFFKTFQGELHRYHASIVTDKDFDSALYKWKMDAIVEITLSNTKTKDAVTFLLRQPREKGGLAEMADWDEIY